MALFTDLNGAHAFFSICHYIHERTHKVPEDLHEGLQLATKLLQNPEADKRILTLTQKEIHYFAPYVNLKSVDSKISALLQKTFQAPKNQGLAAFLSDKVDLIFSQIFHLLNARVFGGWRVNLKKAALEKEMTQLTKRWGEAAESHLTAKQLEFKKREELYQAEGIQVKKALTSLGGERIAVTTADNVKLDGFYLSADAFREKLQEAGAEHFSLEKQLGVPFQEGLMIDADSPLLKTLQEDFAKAGWTFVKLKGANKMLIVDEAWEGQKEELRLPLTAFKREPLKAKASGGTVILGSGTMAVYEMNVIKKEAFSFLLKGQNVVLFNYRGYGESGGTPSVQGTYKDIEAIYQFVKQETHEEDSKIIARGYCLSANIMAELARKHPKINLFLDRTTSSLYAFILKAVEDTVDHYFRGRDKQDKEQSLLIARFVRAILTPLLWALSPAYTVLPTLKTIQGGVHLMEAEGDVRAPHDEYDKMAKTMTKAGTDAHLSRSTLPLDQPVPEIGDEPTPFGPHFINWLDVHKPRYQASRGLGIGEGIAKPKLLRIDYPGREATDKFLQKLGLFSPLF